jgi:hypothetical protein
MRLLERKHHHRQALFAVPADESLALALPLSGLHFLTIPAGIAIDKPHC